MSTSLRNVLTQQRHNVIVFAILVIASLLYYYFKRNHLGFHTRDFQYYLSGYILKTSSNNTGTININPEGFNAYGFSGTDGYPNIFSDIHFSPITYPISALYQLGGEPLVATLFAGAAAAAILLALSLFVRHTDHAKTLTSFATIILLPGFLEFANYDLRVYVLLISFTLILFAFIEWELNAKAVFLIFLALACTREEFIYFSLLAALHLLLRGRRRLSVALFFSALLFCAGYLLYFFYFTTFLYHPTLKNILLFVVPTSLYVAFYVTCWRYGAVYPRPLSDITSQKLDNSSVARYGMLFLYLFPLVKYTFLPPHLLVMLTPRYFGVFFLVIIGMLIIYIHAQKSTTKFFVLGILGILTIAPYVRVVTDISKMNFSQGSVVFAAAKSIDRRSVTLTSLPFHQAFAGYNAFVVDRLPAQSTSDKSRYWPANRERLKRILQTANVLVLDNTDMARIRPLTARAFNCTQSRGVNICIGPN